MDCVDKLIIYIRDSSLQLFENKDNVSINVETKNSFKTLGTKISEQWNSLKNDSLNNKKLDISIFLNEVNNLISGFKLFNYESFEKLKDKNYHSESDIKILSALYFLSYNTKLNWTHTCDYQTMLNHVCYVESGIQLFPNVFLFQDKEIDDKLFALDIDDIVKENKNWLFDSFINKDERKSLHEKIKK